jgi:hypothetical protein
VESTALTVATHMYILLKWKSPICPDSIINTVRTVFDMRNDKKDTSNA